jgi:UDP-N-acetylglucosamine 2-epimerase (non-hydrolysing)
MILICFGTRPEWLKIKPLVEKLDCKLLFTGQHRDLLNEVNVDYRLYPDAKAHNLSSMRLNAVMVDCLAQFPSYDSKYFDYVLVQGDTATAFACALAAFNLKLKVIHLEAGLRTNDLGNPYPEEGYRQMISRIASINLCPTTKALQNLKHEGIENAHVVGNTVLDNLIKYKGSESYGNKVLVTLHRRENHAIMGEWFRDLDDIAKRYMGELEFVLPIHPNPSVLKHRDILQHVNVVEPLNHDDTMKLLTECKFCITDSGGIQEEASFFNKKAIVCRKNTERQEAIMSGHVVLCTKPSDLSSSVEDMLKNYQVDSPCPFGDGKSSDKIKELLDELQRIPERV